MAINDPVPSTAFDVLQRNVQDVDRYLNTSAVFNNRVGLPIKPIPMQSATFDGLETQWLNAIGAVGWFPVSGDFSTGATITARNQVIYDPASTAWYSWGGSLPKTVPAASSPASTGGISAGAWTMRSDAALATGLNNGTALVNGLPARLLASSVPLAGVKNLPSTAGNPASFWVAGFYAGSVIGGGLFIYDEAASKASHNGGTVIAPEAITSWDGSPSSVAQFLNWSGTGFGCFVRYGVQDMQSCGITDFGAHPDIDNAPVINRVYSAGIKTAKIGKGPYTIGSPILMPVNTHLVGIDSASSIFNLTGAMTDANVITYGVGYDYQGYRGSIKHLRINANGNFEKRGVGVEFNSGCDVFDVAFFELKSALVLTGNKYVDKISIKRCYVGYCGGHNTYNSIHLDGPGDALEIDQLSFQLSYNPAAPVSDRDGVYISRFRGGVLSANIINGNLTIRRCDAIEILGTHAEGSQRDDYKTNKTKIKIIRSNVNIDGLYIHKRNDGATIELVKEVNGVSNETGSVTISNTIIDTTELLKSDLAGLDVPDISIEPGVFITTLQNVYRQETYAFAQTQSKTGVKISDNDYFNAFSSSLSKGCIVQPNGTIKGGVMIGASKAPKEYNINQFSNSNAGLPFYEDGASGKTYYIRSIIVADGARRLAMNTSTGFTTVNNVTTGPVGVGRGILVNTVFNSDVQGTGCTVYYYRGEAPNTYNKMAKAPIVLGGFTYDTGLDYSGYPLEPRTPQNIDEFNLVDSYSVDEAGRATFYSDRVPSVGVFTEGDTLVNTYKQSSNWRELKYIGGQWVNKDTEVLSSMLSSVFTYRYAPLFDGTSSHGVFENRVLDVSADLFIEFQVGGCTLGRSQAIIGQQQTSISTNREFLLVANTANNFSLHVGGVSYNTTACKLKSHTSYKVTLQGSALKFYENGNIVESTTFTRGTASEPTARTTIAGAYTSPSSVGLLFAGQLFDVKINGAEYPIDSRYNNTQLPNDINGVPLNLVNVPPNRWITTIGG